MAGEDLVGVLLLRHGGESAPLRFAADLSVRQQDGLVVIFKRPWVSAEGAALANVSPATIAVEIEMEQRRRIRSAFFSAEAFELKYSVSTVGRPGLLRSIPLAAREGCTVLVVQGHQGRIMGRVWHRLAAKVGLRLIFVAPGEPPERRSCPGTDGDRGVQVID